MTDKIVASNDSGKLRIQNLSTQPLTVTGVTNGAATGGTSVANIAGNDTRTNLAQQFNTQRDQLDKFSDDAYFNGVNLLRGDKLKLVFNENGSSSLDIQARDKDGAPVSINNAYLQIQSLIPSDLDSDDSIDTHLATLGKALESMRSQASNFGSNLSIVQNRQDFTKKMINTLQTGADNLVLADTNEEGANLLALQTRQQLSTTALSLSAQADQAVLRLFG
jgi:flagellin-like hook-associated protein FlgL